MSSYGRSARAGRTGGDVETSSSSSSSSGKGGNYQVYRGMSPTTSNRLEQRMKELEDALEQERESHSRTEKELADSHYTIEQLNERLDESENHTSSQVDINRKKDQELLKVKKDIDILNAQNESNESTWKKRNQEVINDLQEQLNKATKQKSKAEKEKTTLSIEIDSLTTQLDSSNKAKSSAESKLENLDEQLRKYKTQIDDFTRSSHDLNGVKSRLTSENAELQRQLHELEQSQSTTSRTKLQLQHALDEAKTKLEDETKVRNTLEIQFNNLQIDFDNLHSQLEDEAESGNGIRGQLTKSQAEYQALKVKYDREIIAKTEELEESRRKLLARCTELEGLAEQAKNKANKLDKEKSKLTIEIRDISLQLDDTNAALNDHAKRLKTAEQRANEFQKRSEEVSTELQNSNGENGRLQVELTRLKTLTSDQQAKIDTLNRDHSKLTDALHEAESQNKDLSRSVQELSSIRIQLTNERDSAFSELGDSREIIRDLQTRLDSSTNSVNQLKSDFELRLREKEDELEGIRKLGGRSVEELQRTIIELETKYKSESSRLKKKYESDHQEFIIQIDNLNRTNAEFAKANKQLSTKLKETESLLESERHISLESRESASVMERKLISITTELEDVRLLLDAADKARKNADNELSEASSRVSELTISIQSVSNDKRRMESDIQGMHRDLDEAILARRSADERADKLQGDLNRISEQLRVISETHSSSETVRRTLETTIKDLTIRLEEAEMSSNGKKPLAKLQARIHELEMELDGESRRGRDAVAENKKLLKQLNDIRSQADEDHRAVAELSDQVNSLQIRITNTKRQLEESEEVLGITMNKYRKTQSMLEESERRADRAEKNVSVVRHTNITTGGAGGARGQRAVSVSRETTRIVRV